MAQAERTADGSAAELTELEDIRNRLYGRWDPLPATVDWANAPCVHIQIESSNGAAFPGPKATTSCGAMDGLMGTAAWVFPDFGYMEQNQCRRCKGIDRPPRG